MDKAIIYNRVSTIEQNPELQLKDCEDYCKSHGWEIVDRIQEKASAFKDDTKREKFQSMLQRAEKGEFNHIVVWNMDRFSRQTEAEVLKLVKKLSVIHGVDVNAVRGDLWSDLVHSLGSLKQQGFIGEATLEFLEKVIRGLEFQRAHRESTVKSERVKLSVDKTRGDKAYSMNGRKWGRKPLNDSVVQQIRGLRKEGKSITQICSAVTYWDKNNNKRNVSRAVVHKLLTGIPAS